MRPILEILLTIPGATALVDTAFGPDLEDLRVRDDGTVVLFSPLVSAVILENHDALAWVARILRGESRGPYHNVVPPSSHPAGLPRMSPAEDGRGSPASWLGAARYREHFLRAASRGAPTLI